MRLDRPVTNARRGMLEALQQAEPAAVTGTSLR